MVPGGRSPRSPNDAGDTPTKLFAVSALQGLAFGFVLLRVESLAEEGKVRRAAQHPLRAGAVAFAEDGMLQLPGSGQKRCCSSDGSGKCSGAWAGRSDGRWMNG